MSTRDIFAGIKMAGRHTLSAARNVVFKFLTKNSEVPRDVDSSRIRMRWKFEWYFERHAVGNDGRDVPALKLTFVENFRSRIFEIAR